MLLPHCRASLFVLRAQVAGWLTGLTLRGERLAQWQPTVARMTRGVHSNKWRGVHATLLPRHSASLFFLPIQNAV